MNFWEKIWGDKSPEKPFELMTIKEILNYMRQHVRYALAEQDFGGSYTYRWSAREYIKEAGEEIERRVNARFPRPPGEKTYRYSVFSRRKMMSVDSYRLSKEPIEIGDLTWEYLIIYKEELESGRYNPDIDVDKELYEIKKEIERREEIAARGPPTRLQLLKKSLFGR